MSTSDVPGHKPEHNDELAMGCWAEHDDGSLILVESAEGGRVVYSMFDMAEDPPVEYRDAMPEDGFKTHFSWPGTSFEKWTWHDKTVFPWDRVMAHVKSGARYPSADALQSAAARVARSLHLRAREIKEDRFKNMTEATARRGRGVVDKIQRAIQELRT